MKTMRIVSAALLSALLIFSSAMLCFAAGSSSVAISKTWVNVGDTVTVTVTFSASENMVGGQGNLTYDPSVFQYVHESNDSNGGAGSVQFLLDNGSAGSKTLSVSMKFTAIKAGGCSFTTGGCFYSNSDLAEVSVSAASASVSVADASQSGNADLSSLRTQSGSLTPAFSAGVTSYTVNVDSSVTSGRLYASTADPNATIAVEGAIELKEGRNVRTVVVTAPNGTVKRYTVTFIRGTAEEPPVSSDPGQADPLEVTIGGARYFLRSSLAGIELFNGFEAVGAEYNGNPVQTAICGDYTLYYLAAEGSDTAEPFVLKDGSFSPLTYFRFGEKTFIPEDDGAAAPVGYRQSSVTIGDATLDAYISGNEDLKDFYILYLFAAGKSGYYRYDSLENTLQRAPEFLAGAVVTVTPDDDTASEEPARKVSFLSRFSALNGYQKLTVSGIVLAIILFIALLAVMAARHFTEKKLMSEQAPVGDYALTEENPDPIFEQTATEPAQFLTSTEQLPEPEETPEAEPEPEPEKAEESGDAD